MADKVEVEYFTNEGYSDWGYYLKVNGNRATIESEDPRYPNEIVFASYGDALEYYLENFTDVILNVEY